MPQFDLSVYSSQIFWICLCFALLMLYTFGYSVPRLKKVLEERWNKTEGYRLEAERLNKKAAALEKHIQENLEEARRQASEIITATATTLSKELLEEKNKISTTFKAKIVEAEKVLNKSISKADLDAQELSEELALAIAQKLWPTSKLPKPSFSKGHHD